ncbi:MAG: type IV toxin-antitoxin system AbiEi family antitoxin [Bacteroidetes bacterium]|jgi:hypothetical protein|nr:type IV toxin-antitoxin system AbiEi family antitoxin [Bacteroidota bacterium]
MKTPVEDTLAKTLLAFENQTGIEIRRLGPPPQDQLFLRADERVLIEFPEGMREYDIEVKQTLTGATIGQLAERLGQAKEHWILVTRYAYPQLANAMRELGVQFLDATGNAFLRGQQTYIHIQAHRRARDTWKAREELFGVAGIRVAFALMCKPELLNANYREITQAAQVALGTVAGVMKQLAQKGYLIEHPNNRRTLTRRKDLLNLWTQAYTNRLRPKKLIGRFAAKQPDFWQKADLTRHRAQWGGEVGGHFLTRFLKPEVITMYVHRPTNELMLDLKLRKDEYGMVEIRDRFWRFDTQEPNPNVAPPLLVYADLMATNEARNIQTAQMVYDQYLRRYFEQD